MSNLSALAATTFRSPHDVAATPDLETAASEFEAYLLGEFLRLSEASSLHEGPMDGGKAGKMMRSMFHQQIAQIVGQHGGLGVARMLREDLAAAAGTADEPGGAQDPDGER